MRRPDEHIQPDALNTLIVEGLLANCTHREVPHNFHLFIGFKEVRLAQKDPRCLNGDRLLYFVEVIDARYVIITL